MNTHTNIKTEAAKASALAMAALHWMAEADKDPRSLECWRSEYRVLLAIQDMCDVDIGQAIEDLASNMDEHFHFDAEIDARPSESYIPAGGGA